MKFQHAVAALASTIDYTKPAEISVAADFFHAYPRLSSVPKTFATNVAYRISIYKLAIPYAVTGLILFLAALIANFYFFFKRGVVPGADDTHESDPNVRDRTGRAFLLFSCFLNLAIIICIGISFESAFVMRQAANNAHDALGGAKETIMEQLQTPAQFLQTLAAKAADTAGEGASLTAESTVRSFIVNHKTSFDSIVNATEQILDKATLIDDQFRHLSLRYFLLTITVLMACMIGLLCSFVLDASIPTSRSVRIVTFALLLLPMVAMWVHTAFSTSVAAASGDFCQAVEQYHRHIDLEASGKTVSPPKSNIFIDFGLRCPTSTEEAQAFRRLNTFLGTMSSTGGLVDEGFNEGFSAVVGDDIAKAWPPARIWMQNSLQRYGDCTTQLKLAGQIAFHICGGNGMSAMSAIGQLWLCSCGITLLFGLVVGLLTFGHPPSEFCSGRELMYIYGAPKLISAFGDVRGVLTRHSTFHKMELMKNFSSASSSWISSENFSEMEKGEDGKLDDDDTSMSTERERRNAYTTHKLREKKAKNSDWRSSRSSRSSSSSDSSRLS